MKAGLSLHLALSVYVEEREKAAAARAALVVENVKRTEESELDEEAILDDKNEPQIDFPGEREHSEGEVHSDEDTTSVMETDPPAAASQRTPEIADRTEFPEVHRLKRNQEEGPARRNTSSSRQSTSE